MNNLSEIKNSESGLYSYDKALSVLTSQGKFHINLGLERVSKLLELLGNPQDNLKVIHVAGTNGKGSTCAMLASILKEAGYRAGLYTSPHLVDYTERVKVNGENISKENFAELFFKILDMAEKNDLPVTEFEILTVLAFIYFNQEKVDYVVLETGLGGRLDATNVIKFPLVSVITTIDFDHTDRLGNTISEIAFEKAGIIKESVSVITLKDNNGIDILREVSAKRQSEIILADSSEYILTKDCTIKTPDDEFSLPLLGMWQTKNLSLVIETVKLLNKSGIFISDEAVKQGLKNVKWQGRLQYIKEKSLVLDGAHNLSGAELLRESLDFYFPDKKRIWVYSSINTKDYGSIIKALFNPDDIVICTKSSMKSAVGPEILQQKINDETSVNKIYTVDNIKESVKLSTSLLRENYLIIVAGSLYTIGEVLALSDI